MKIKPTKGQLAKYIDPIQISSIICRTGRNYEILSSAITTLFEDQPLGSPRFFVMGTGNPVALHHVQTFKSPYTSHSTRFFSQTNILTNKHYLALDHTLYQDQGHTVGQDELEETMGNFCIYPNSSVLHVAICCKHLTAELQ